MTEIWLPISEYLGRYEVSSLGRVRSVDRDVGHRFGKASMRGRVLSPGINKAGYAFVSLSKESSGKTFSVHRLVASAFLGSGNGMEVNHKDLNKSNNSVDNLEWVTRSYNHTHALDAGRSNALDNPNCIRKLNREMVAEIFIRRKSGEPCTSIASSYGVDKSSIYRVLKGKMLVSVI